MPHPRPREADSASPGWTYRRADTAGVVEIGMVRGRDVALPAHFHDEDQITVVLSGRRRFGLRGAILTVEAGGRVLIPAGVAHRSLDEPAEVACLNFYLPPGADAAAVLDEIARLARAAAGIDPTVPTAAVQHREPREANDTSARVGPRRSVAQRAARAGLGREGFSRAFTRAHDMPPHAFGLVTRLNHARRLLRADAPLADVALEAGFADQSHLGRCFRRVFGVTPGRYRAGHQGERSRTFQTRE